MSRPKPGLLIGPPKPREPSVWPKRIALLLALTALPAISAAWGYSEGLDESAAVLHEATVAQEQLEACLRMGEQVRGAAMRAGAELARVWAYQREAREYAEMFAPETVVETEVDE